MGGKMYLLNEKDYIRNILAAKKKPDDLSMGYLINLLSKYYYSPESDAVTLSEIVKEQILGFHLDNYQEYQYHNKIISACQELFEGTADTSLKQREYIPVYEPELHLIHSLPGDRQRKLMFTIYAVARYMGCDGWVNKKDSKGILEIFKLANVTATSEKRNELLHEFYTRGIISFGKRINNLNFKVHLEDTGEIVYKIRDFNNLGNQYIGNFKQGYRQCKSCGKAYKVKSEKDYSSRYCEACAIERRKSANRKSMTKAREMKKCVQSHVS